MAHDVDEPEYPREWVELPEGGATCTGRRTDETHPRKQRQRIKSAKGQLSLF